jgi:hypothetical protein
MDTKSVSIFGGGHSGKFDKAKTKYWFDCPAAGEDKIEVKDAGFVRQGNGASEQPILCR